MYKKRNVIIIIGTPGLTRYHEVVLIVDGTDAVVFAEISHSRGSILRHSTLAASSLQCCI
jgi:hypothetical protein